MLTISVVLGLLAMILAVSILLRSVFEAVFAPLFDNIPVLVKYKWLQVYLAIIAGIGMAFFYSLDFVYLLAQYIELDWHTFTSVTWVGITFTGASIGLGANFIHKLLENIVDKWSWLKNLLGRNEAGE